MARNMREEAEKRARCEARGEKYGERQYECIVRKKFRERVSSRMDMVIRAHGDIIDLISWFS